MRLIRALIFIPICFLVIMLIYWCFGVVINLLTELNTFWIVVAVFFGGSMAWSIFKFLSAILMGFASRISPSRSYSFWLVLIISVINCVMAVFNAWTMDVDYSGKVIFFTVVFSFLMLELTAAIVIGASADLAESNYSNY
jgi:hypothetical protein